MNLLVSGRLDAAVRIPSANRLPPQKRHHKDTAAVIFRLGRLFSLCAAKGSVQEDHHWTARDGPEGFQIWGITVVSRFDAERLVDFVLAQLVAAVIVVASACVLSGALLGPSYNGAGHRPAVIRHAHS